MTTKNGEPRASDAVHGEDGHGGEDQTLRLYEEELVAHKEWREVGEVVVRTEISEEPDRIDVEAARQEIEVEHLPVGQAVEQREAPFEKDGAIFIPVYEEQLIVQKRLYLREYVKVARVEALETRSFTDTVRRERAVIEAPPDQDLVRERFRRSDR